MFSYTIPGFCLTKFPSLQWDLSECVGCGPGLVGHDQREYISAFQRTQNKVLHSRTFIYIKTHFLAYSTSSSLWAKETKIAEVSSYHRNPSAPAVCSSYGGYHSNRDSWLPSESFHQTAILGKHLNVFLGTSRGPNTRQNPELVPFRVH